MFYFLFHRDNLCNTFTALEKYLLDIASISEQLLALQEKIVKLDKETSILNEAITTPHHPLITMQNRYVDHPDVHIEMYIITAVIDIIINYCFSLSEQSRLAADHKKLLQLLRGRYEESVQWNMKYKVHIIYKSSTTIYAGVHN